MEPSPAAAAAQPPAVREQQASQPVQPKTTVNPAATTLPALPSTISSLRDLPPLPSPTRKMPVPPTSLPTASQSALVYLARSVPRYKQKLRQQRLTLDTPPLSQ